ncbi:amidohydrolase family protein [Mesorhizobium sp. M1A.F.Ca.ET.072.01.1.1]|nr:amidohydrolase family protein [Mesorhizobium sp. M1A.F.Ca.ET.072.01.1.1]TIV04864.1 MAG: amidohydrolase family protein [Mesorhizobium sp.]
MVGYAYRTAMSDIVITNASLLDPRDATLRSGQQIRIEGQKIVEVAGSVGMPQGATRINAGGRVVMPGLIDAHVHAMAYVNNQVTLANTAPYLVAAHASKILADYLRRGFTTVRDSGGADAALADATRLNLFPGPRLFVPGLALAVTGGLGDFRVRTEHEQGCPHCRSTRNISRVVDGVDAVRRAVREEIAAGAHQIKLMAGGGNSGKSSIYSPHFSLEEQRVAVQEAADFGTYVMAHCYGVEVIRRALEAGVRTIEHANLIDEDTARLVAEKNAYVVPTLSTFEASIFYADQLGTPAHIVEQVKMMLRRGVEAVKICRDAGVKLGFGTDLEGVMHHYQLHEFKIRSAVETPAQTLHSATIVNAEIVRHAGKLGELIPGAFADILIVDGNPLEDIGVFQEDGSGIRVTIKDGCLHKREI